MKKVWVIYLLICIPEEKGYVGQTSTTIDKRCRKGKGYRKDSLIRSAFDAYTEDDFVCIVLEENITSQELADEREQYWISFFNTTDPRFGYNREPGGKKGYHINEATCKKISENHSHYWQGKTRSDETKQKMVESHKKQRKRVQKLSLDGQFLEEYSSISEAAERNKMCYVGISDCCHGRAKTAGEHIWKLV